MVDQVIVAGAVLAADWQNALVSTGSTLGKAAVVMVVVGIGGAVIDAVARYIKNRFM
ncbi:hypothetical protein BISA_2069 [Bifidobacterium saguini DSM 23967]|uniref:Uncharacterized protein n=3 Tax=Bifidobacterium TaxID=1678 RepID=A0A2N5IUW0_9BIFI|nr:MULTISPECIES: hypothetical protein [Bifidobacterium]KFI91106.1 hypothetical protein BISA_2069 [Bifidobacterium saguini DSM 23967]PLS25765.1 hypothetical protein Tam1G_0180 [Bifidobacterium imperatoris]QSY58277.1 hypothetical protein BLI708_02945 [Bifidobacterium imperatoris]QTB90034.1 hypothetical protein BSD967_06590 [Bifidobacterium saguini]